MFNNTRGFWLYAAIATAAFILILVAGCFGKSSDNTTREVAATVNGEKVYVDDVNEFYAYRSPQQANMSKADALSLVIEREILYQEAVKEKLSVTTQEVDQEYKAYLTAGNLTESELKFELAGKGSTIEAFKLAIMKRMLINMLLNKKIPSQYVLKHEEVEGLYNASRFPQLNITFDQAERTLVSVINAQRQNSAKNAYINALKDKANVLIINVPN